MVFSGDPGIGKTTLWQVGLEIAAQEGFDVLSTRSSQSEAGLPFAALADLIDGIDPSILERVPAPQMHAVEIALRRAVPDSEPPEPFAISSGFLCAVRALAGEARPLIAVDDVQWLDQSSADCLLFLARRLSDQQVRFLLSRRGVEPSNLERALEPLGVLTVEVEGMSMGAIGRILSDRFGLALPRRVLYQLFEASHGNPLFALELGRTIQEAGIPDPGSEMPAPKRVDDAFGARVQSLPGAARRALLAAALSASLTRSELQSVVGPLVLEDAIDAGLLTVDRFRVRPSHPMIAAAARKQSSAVQRRDLHLTLAGVVEDPVLSARHQAMATVGADEAIARTLVTAARLAIERGAVHEAEELSAHALRLTPAGAAEESGRLLELARCHLNAGDLPGAAALLQDRIDYLPRGRPRALAHLLLGEASDGATEEEEINLAIAEAGDDRELYGVALCRKAVLFAVHRVQRMVEAEALAREAQSYTEGTLEEDRGRLALAWSLLMRGQCVEALRPVSIAVRSGVNVIDAVVDRPAAIQRAFRGDLGEAREMLLHLDTLAEQHGDPLSRVGIGIQLCEFSLRSGNLPECQAALADLELWIGLDEIRIACARLKALIAAHRGDPVEVERWAGVVLDESACRFRATWDYLEANRAMGLAALFEGDFASSVRRFEAVWGHCRTEGVDDPGAFPVAGNLVEALVECGAMDRAAELTGVLERLSCQQQHPWGLATTKRAWAMIDLARGDVDTGGAGLLSAASDLGRLGLEFEQAQCLLYLGRIQRRLRKRSDARQRFEDAAARFDRLGCQGWAIKARSELSRVSGRRAADDSELTPGEQRVVDLAVTGLSNKEIAAVLYVSVNTVEAHLSHAYAKLGVRSRSQLVGRLNRA
jgi:DNA-binding CsgD family transcriptional regulator